MLLGAPLVRADEKSPFAATYELQSRMGEIAVYFIKSICNAERLDNVSRKSINIILQISRMPAMPPENLENFS
jgi:hypothetical protein